MTFLNPLALFGLAAAAIPILIHLLNLRKLKTIEFSTLRFLRELQKTTMRRLRLRQWILLVLRTLLVLFLVFAFARPALMGSFPYVPGGRATNTMVLILDDSPSMGLRNAQGVLFDQAKNLSSDVVRSAQSSDRLFFLRLSEVHNAGGGAATASSTTLPASLRSLSPSLRTYPYQEALDVAGRLLAENRTANREVYIFGDGQATQFSSREVKGDSTRQLDPDARVFFVEIPPLSRNNVAVSSLEVKNQILSPNKPVTMRAVVHNYGEDDLRNCVVSLYLDGARVAQQSADLVPRGTTTLTFQSAPRRRGILPGYLQLEDDALIADNQFFYVLNVPERTAVVIAGHTAEQTTYASIALTLTTDTAQAGQYDVAQTTEDRLSSKDFRSIDVLVLSGVQSLTSGMADRIAQFVKSGGGLLLFPGPTMDLQAFNTQILPRLGIPALRQDESRQPGTTNGGTGSEGFSTFSNVDLAHPLFSGMFEERSGTRRSQPELESPRIRSAVTLSPTTRCNILIQMSDGRPFLIEYPVGEGRVLMFAVEAGMTWSDFPVKGLFAPLVHRAVAYLASGRQVSGTGVVGKPLQITARVNEGNSRTPHVVKAPSGAEERLVPLAYSATGAATFRTAPTEEAGIYTLHPVGSAGTIQADKQIQASAVNLAPEESDLRAVTNEEWDRFWKESGFAPERVRRMTADTPLEAAIHESRYGVELWSLFILLALACAAAEMLLGRENKEIAALEDGHGSNV